LASYIQTGGGKWGILQDAWCGTQEGEVFLKVRYPDGRERVLRIVVSDPAIPGLIETDKEEALSQIRREMRRRNPDYPN